VFHQI